MLIQINKNQWLNFKNIRIESISVVPVAKPYVKIRTDKYDINAQYFNSVEEARSFAKSLAIKLNGGQS